MRTIAASDYFYKFTLQNKVLCVSLPPIFTTHTQEAKQRVLALSMVGDI